MNLLEIDRFFDEKAALYNDKKVVFRKEVALNELYRAAIEEGTSDAK